MSQGIPVGLFLPNLRSGPEERRVLSIPMAMYCLLSVVYGEARGESDVGKQAVAHVVLNRARSSRDSVCKETSKTRQFVRRKAPADFVIDVSDKDPTDGAIYFKNYPGRWGRHRFIKKIGRHYFYGD